eukprot:gene1054-1336_t
MALASCKNNKSNHTMSIQERNYVSMKNKRSELHKAIQNLNNIDKPGTTIFKKIKNKITHQEEAPHLTPEEIADQKRKKIEKIKKILSDPKTDVNHQAKYNHTPLHFAIQYQALEVVQLLVQHPKIKINMEDTYRNTPLHAVCQHQALRFRSAYAEVLLTHPAIDVNLPNEHKRTPLHEALYNHNPQNPNTNNLALITILSQHQQIDTTRQDDQHVSVKALANRLNIYLRQPAINLYEQDNEGAPPYI